MSRDLSVGVHEVDVDVASRAEVQAGAVLKWRRRGDTWEGFVVRETSDGDLQAEWVPALVLAPLGSTTR